MGRGSWWYGGYFPPSRPRKAEGGIKSQSKQGNFGQSWWAKRWIQVLESFDIGARLSRGRSYARQGQVLSIDIAAGTVRAKVQGSRPMPYEVTIRVSTLSDSDWKKLLAELNQQVIFVAKMLAGEIPQDIEQVFKAAGLSLFPAKLNDLKTNCSCPDWSNPCKHIAAVYYLLGEEFDRDPFLIFRLRGLNREALMSRLERKDPKVERRPELTDATDVSPMPEPLAEDLGVFWGSPVRTRAIEDRIGSVEMPRVPAPLPRRLGGFPFWRGESPFLDSLIPIYASASARGMDVLLGSIQASSQGEQAPPNGK